MAGSGCRPTLCSIFYREKEFMNIDNFFALKKLEWQAHREHQAAIKIQTYFRKWITLKNMKLVNDAAVKIQCLVRRFLARCRVAYRRKQMERRKQREIKHRAAAKIQSRWKGCYVRKNCLDYKKYKDIKGKNEEYAHCIEVMNNFEALATCSATSSLTSEDKDEILKRLLTVTSLTDILKLSPSRICELTAHIEEINQTCTKRGGRPRARSITLEDTLRAECAKFKVKGLVEEDITFEPLVESLPSLLEFSKPPPSKPHKVVDQGYSCYIRSLGQPPQFECQPNQVDDMFKDLSGIPGTIQPDREKVERLKEAIKMLRSNLEMREEAEQAKKHYLLRTYQSPGVLSDICSHELTPAEKKLKNIKFWNPRRSPSLDARSNTYTVIQSPVKLSKVSTADSSRSSRSVVRSIGSGWDTSMLEDMD